MTDRLVDSFNRMYWHDSKLLSIEINRNEDVDEVILNIEMRGVPGQVLKPIKMIFEDAVFFFSDLDLQGKRECADDISGAKCGTETALMLKLRNEKLKNSPDSLKGYFHFSIYLIPPGGSIDIIAAGFKSQEKPGTDGTFPDV